jgi:hypothetical protein
MSSLKSYLARLEACLGSLPLNARRDVLEELRGHLEDRAAALQAGGLEKEVSMSAAIERFGEAREIGTALQDVHGQGSWGEVLKGMVPFLLQPIFFILGSAIAALDKYLHLTDAVLPIPVLVAVASLALLAFSGAFLVVLGVGWVEGFPRWSYPYGGLVLAFTSLVVADRLDLWIIFNRYARWIPLLVMAAIALLLGRLWRPLRSLYKGVWHDWSQLSFGLYGILPLALMIVFDEVHGEEPYVAVLGVILAIGALAYMRSSRTWQRALTLLLGMTLAWTAATVYLAIYWHGRHKSSVTETARGMLIALGVLVALLLAPALLGLLRRSVQSIRAG